MKSLSLWENGCDKNNVIYSKSEIENYISGQIQAKGLDERTEKAYRLDLNHLYVWLEEHGKNILKATDIEEYLQYLVDKNLKPSTITRKYRVICYYLEYLGNQGILSEKLAVEYPIFENKEEKSDNILSKSEVDSFFAAMSQQYSSFDKGFRKRVCLRDSVMMELLFYHRIEISELLRLKLSDYSYKTGGLTICGKRERKRVEYLFSRELKNKLEQWISEHEFFERDNEYQNVLFLSKIGKPISMKMVILIFDKYRKMAGIKKEATPKDLKCSMERYARELMIERCS